MFALSPTPIDAQALRDSVRNVRAGGFVAFEGWVRDHNEGRAVSRLEYEAYDAVCLSEGNEILAEAIDRFGLLEARCVHRTGALALQDMAVWVGVSAAHRGEAFEACRYIIDAVKHRLPIWKKEYYTDGDSGWVNCERCAAHADAHAHRHDDRSHAQAGSALSEADYYARQMQLREVGPSGQDQLRQARVLVVGAGGLGSPVLQYLAAAGVGTIGIVEGDLLEPSNLHRQVIFDAEALGAPKAELAAARLRAQNPFIQIAVHPERVRPDNVAALIAPYEIIVDCTDNFETKFLLNDAAVLHEKLLVQASLYQYEGQLFVYDPNGEGPCVRCLWPEIPAPGCVGSCAEVGVLGAVPGVFGALQATEVLKHLLDLPGKLQGDTLFLDLLSLRSHTVKGARERDCPVCGESPTITAIAPELPVEVTAADLGTRLPHFSLIDIREPGEAGMPLPGATLSLPASGIQIGGPPIPCPEPWVFCCSRGMRSRYLAMAMRRAGYSAAYSLSGGVRALPPQEPAPGGQHL